MKKLNVGILLFDNVEVLDFCGPFEVFSTTRVVPGLKSRASDDHAPFKVFTVARQTVNPVVATGGMRVLCDYDFGAAPNIDILLVPGGLGTRDLLDDRVTHRWIRSVSDRARITCSVCTGSLLLAKAGILDGKRATTHWGGIDLLGTLGNNITVERECRFVDDGIITSAGVSAGIDMALYLVERECGSKVATDTARYMDYQRA